MISRRLVSIVFVGLAVSMVHGDPPAAAGRRWQDLRPPVGLFSTGTVEALSGTLRGYLVRNLPCPLYEASPGWGRTTRVTTGVKWHGQGLHVHPQVTHGERNNGTWRKVRVTAQDPADTLVLDLRDLRQPEPGRMTFDVFVSLDARVEYEVQKWADGARLCSSSARARLRVKLLLACEATARLEPGGGLLPDAVFRLQVTRADLHLDNVVVEHIAGVGGEAAKVLGDALRGGVREWRPELEAELLARANAAIEKAGDSKEVRVSLSKLWNHAAPPKPPDARGKS